MKVQIVSSASKPRTRKSVTTERREESPDLLIISDDQSVGSALPRARLLSQVEFQQQSYKLGCRVILLNQPARETLVQLEKLWPEAVPLVLVVSDSVPEDRSDFVRISTDEARKSSFALLVRALIRDRKEKKAHDVLARITHDMRSPMSVIKMACQFVKRKSSEDATLRYVQMIEESSAAIQTLIGDILDYSKLNQGSVSLHTTQFDLQALLTSVVDSTRLLVREKDVAVRSTFSQLPRTVSGDPGRLRQILGNLLSNAVKFTEAGHVELRAHEKDGICYFEVADTGIGIPEKSLKKIFQPYKQADSSIMGRFGGTGLGLNICKHLVERMGGSIQVRSRLGEGSVFSFNIQLPAVERTAGLATTVDWKGRQVWHLSDSCPKAWVTGYKAEQVNVLGFTSPHQLAQRAVLGNPDLLVFDLEKGGFDELERILAYFPKKLPGVVVTTSVGQRGDGVRCKALGVGGYLSSPFTFEELKAVSELVLHGEPGELYTKHTLKERGLTLPGNE